MPGDAIKLSSADSLEDRDDTFRFNIEYLNTLRPNGFPRHNIILKPGMPLMLLRNTNPREGPCNGTRMIFDTTINNKLLRCTIAGTAKQVLIPRITFRPKEDNSPFSGAGASSPSQLHSPPQSTRPKDRLSSSSEYCCANLSAATASSMWLRPGLGPRPNSSSPSNLNHHTHQIRKITLCTERSCCRTDTARRGRQRPLRVLWTPCHVSVIPAFFY